MYVFVVFGETGEYSDMREWPVAAYIEERLAILHMEFAAKRFAELSLIKKERTWKPMGHNEYDPDMQVDYTGTFYEVKKVLLGDEAYLSGLGDS